jgi:hypothetical protein
MGGGSRRPSVSLFVAGVLVWFTSLILTAAVGSAQPAPGHVRSGQDPIFQSADNCVACHNGLVTGSGEDVSIGLAWRASMMANSARDPYWQAAVRRETIDHPAAVDEIEDECAICHMPMARTRAKASGTHGEVFAHLPVGERSTLDDVLAADGVSCTVCHQIDRQGLGTPASFTGGFSIVNPTSGTRTMLGPFEIDRGRTAVMRSATGVAPGEARYVQESELCATCHTLFTTALGARGEPLGSLPEQVPYLEWRHSSFRDRQSCQACHMPAVDHPTPIASVLGEPREGLSRHTFLGGNFFMLRMLNRYRTALGVAALPAELDAVADATVRQLQSDTATISIGSPTIDPERQLRFEVAVTNKTGHKLPTGYPSRRAWLHVTVRDGTGRTVFESGAVDARGAIAGNDHDDDPLRYEPHYDEIERAGEVQIYESVMADSSGAPTTGLLRGVAFVKDNRLLPGGFDKRAADADIAVRGGAAEDDTFVGGGDRVTYRVDVGSASGPFAIEAELRYQPIAFRWARNLAAYDAAETRRFVSYYDQMAADSSVVLARATRP